MVHPTGCDDNTSNDRRDNHILHDKIDGLKGDFYEQVAIIKDNQFKLDGKIRDLTYSVNLLLGIGKLVGAAVLLALVAAVLSLIIIK